MQQMAAPTGRLRELLPARLVVRQSTWPLAAQDNTAPLIAELKALVESYEYVCGLRFIEQGRASLRVRRRNSRRFSKTLNTIYDLSMQAFIHRQSHGGFAHSPVSSLVDFIIFCWLLIICADGSINTLFFIAWVSEIPRAVFLRQHKMLIAIGMEKRRANHTDDIVTGGGAFNER